MRVKVSEACRVYWNYGVVELAEGQLVEGAFAAHLASTGVDVEVVEADPAPVEPPAELDIDASASVVLAWVGEDPERAGVALAAEQARDKPRSTLVAALTKLAG